MSSIWAWEARVIEEHDREKPFAPENGQPLKFKAGDPVVVTNEYGVQFNFRVTGLYAPEEPCSMYATGYRYLLDWGCYWFPAREATLALDTVRREFETILDPGYLQAIKDQCVAGRLDPREDGGDWASLCGCPGLAF